MIAIMTGHLECIRKALWECSRVKTYLQYDLAIQLLQLENVFLTLSTSPVIDLLPSRLPNTMSFTPLCTLLRMAAVMCGILNFPERSELHAVV